MEVIKRAIEDPHASKLVLEGKEFYPFRKNDSVYEHCLVGRFWRTSSCNSGNRFKVLCTHCGEIVEFKKSEKTVNAHVKRCTLMPFEYKAKFYEAFAATVEREAKNSKSDKKQMGIAQFAVIPFLI
jgi:hypothetical protein